MLLFSSDTDASILVYKFRQERPGFNMYAEYTWPQLTFLALVPWFKVFKFGRQKFGDLDVKSLVIWTINLILSSKMTMSDLHAKPYHSNLYLINKMEDIIVFPYLKLFNFDHFCLFYSRSIQVNFVENPNLKIFVFKITSIDIYLIRQSF